MRFKDFVRSLTNVWRLTIDINLSHQSMKEKRITRKIKLLAWKLENQVNNTKNDRRKLLINQRRIVRKSGKRRTKSSYLKE
jgi:hypothetical protein